VRTISGLINKFSDRKLNILCCPTHERYQTGFEDIDATFHMIQFNSCKEWINEYAPVPKNHVLWPKNYYPKGIRFDCVLSQHKFGQFQFLAPIARQLNIPLISLEHTLPKPNWTEQDLEMFQDMRGDVNVFISEYSKDKWGFNNITNSIVVHHMVNCDLFKPSESRANMVLSVVNDFKNRDIFCGYSIYQKVVELVGKEHFYLVGDTPGLSKKAKSTEELVKIYSSMEIFLNTSTVSPIPTSLLEAMSSGCAVVSTATCMIPEIIKNGVNGFISNDEEELAEYIQLLLSDSDLSRRLGEEARKTIINDFHKDRFTKVWEHVFRSICK
jgi:hypothetical protein